MIATKTMRRESTMDNGDYESMSSDESRGRGEFMSRASQIFTGLGRGVSFLHAQNNNDEQLNRLQERFIEAKQSNLFNMRGSSICSGHDSIIDQEDLSLSDGSIFEMPKFPDEVGVSDDDTGGMVNIDQEEDIDRLQLEIQAPCAAIHAQSHQLTRALSGVTLNSLMSDDSSKEIEQTNQQLAERMSVLPFFNKGLPGLFMKRDQHEHSHPLTKLSPHYFNDNSNKIGNNCGNHMKGTFMPSQTVLTEDFGSSANEYNEKRKSSSWNQIGFIPGSFTQTLEEKEGYKHVFKEQEKSKAAAKLMYKHFQTANNPQSFRDLQKRMKEKGAVTGTSVRAFLQNTHELDSGSFSSFSSDDGERLKLDQSAKRRFLASTGIEPASQEFVLKRESNSEIDTKQEELQQRLCNDPLFTNIDPRSYVRLPSREPTLQFLVNKILCSTDEGKSALFTIRGGKYLGKSKLMHAVIDDCQRQSQNSFTVLKSERSANSTMISFFPFSQILSSALRACDEKTKIIRERSINNDTGESSSEDSVFTIVRRLQQRKVIDASDQLMISRILPDVMLESRGFLSLLGERSPKTITQDTAATLFKLFIPLQPVLLVFDENGGGGGGGLDASSWDLLEQLVLMSSKSCPQMIPILISRQPLNIPESLIDVQIDVGLSGMTKEDSMVYIRAIFDTDCLDMHMTVDENALDVVHARANGCPLFLERLLLWAQNKEIIELDETRNAVAINNFATHESELADLLPMTLYEEVLTEINNLSNNELECLKLACCMGTMFSTSTYEALYSEGVFDVLRSLMKTHRIFYIHDNLYNWRQSVVFDAVSSIIITDERQEIHERICNSFGRSVSTTCDVQRARHYSVTRMLSECFDQYMDAGKQSEKFLDYTHAVTCYRQAKLSRRKRSALREKIACSTSLGWCLQALERYDDAEKELESALEWAMSLSENERHEEYSLLTALAKVKSFRSKYREAIELYERALPLVDTNAHSSKWLAVHTSSYGEILLKSGELHRAKELHTEALKYREIAVEDNSGTAVELAISFTQLGRTHFALQDFERASYYHKKALSARVSNLDFYSAPVSESLNYCADSLQSMGLGREALPLAIHAVTIRKTLFGMTHSAYAHAMSVLASTYFSIDRPLESLEIIKECIDICDESFPPNHSDLIPKLMLYGKVLRVTGDIMNSLLAYKRALFVHVINFTSNQNQLQLNELNTCITELEASTTSHLDIIPEMPPPSIDSDLNKTNLIICSKLSRSCDEYAFCVASSLKQMGTVNLVAVVAAGQPQDERIQHARHALDSLLLSEVPVAFSKINSSLNNSHGGSRSPYIGSNGVEMISRVLNEASRAKSITILCDSCPADIAKVMMKFPTLFTEKVKAVIIVGSVKPQRRRSDIGPMATDDIDYDQAMRQVYAGCQQFNIQTISMSNDVSNGFPFSSSSVDGLTYTNHMISLDIQRKEEAHARLVWENGPKESRKNVFGNEKPKTGQLQSIWPLVKSINIELVLGVLCCIPHYQNTHFRWEKHCLNGIEHKICRYQSAKAGMLKTQSLSDEIFMLVGFAMRAALLNTSC